MEEIRLDRERNHTYPLWVWEVYALARQRGCSREEAFRLLWGHPPGGPWKTDCILDAARALLLWRELENAQGLLELLFRANDPEAFLWAVLLLAGE